MADYLIKTCTWSDMDDLQSLSANALRNSPITNALLTNPPGSHRSNTVHTRHTLAHHIYLQALQAQDAPASTTKVIKAINTRGPTQEMQACAWVQWYHDTEDVMEDISEIPDCIDYITWLYVEDVRHSIRKKLINGAGHYLIKTLHFAPNPPGYTAARELLSRIDRMDTQYPALAITKNEHAVLYRELGWEDVGIVAFGAVRALDGEGEGKYSMRAFLRRGGGGL